MEAEFTARIDLPDLIYNFLQDLGNNWHPQSQLSTSNPGSSTQVDEQHHTIGVEQEKQREENDGGS